MQIAAHDDPRNMTDQNMVGEKKLTEDHVNFLREWNLNHSPNQCTLW